MNFSLSSLLAGFVFSVFGVYFFRRGKQDGNIKLIVIGLIMMLYTYFTPNPWADWGVGLLLSYGGYYFFNG